MNFFISLMGWAIWTIAELYIAKSAKDNDNDPTTSWNFKEYAKSNWPVWIGSLLCIAVVLWIGYRNLNINPIGDILGTDTKFWQDLYILGAGPLFQAFIYLVKKVKAFFRKKESEL